MYADRDSLPFWDLLCTQNRTTEVHSAVRSENAEVLPSLRVNMDMLDRSLGRWLICFSADLSLRDWVDYYLITCGPATSSPNFISCTATLVQYVNEFGKGARRCRRTLYEEECQNRMIGTRRTARYTHRGEGQLNRASPSASTSCPSTSSRISCSISNTVSYHHQLWQ